MITGRSRADTKQRYLIGLPAYKAINNVHNAEFPQLDTPHTTLLYPARALLKLYELHSTQRLTETCFKGHTCSFEGIAGVPEHKVHALPFYFDAFPCKGLKGASSLVLCSTQYPRWRPMAAGNPKTMWPLMISAGSDGSADNELLIDAVFASTRAALNSIVAEPFKDRWKKTHTVTMKDALLVVGFSL